MKQTKKDVKGLIFHLLAMLIFWCIIFLVQRLIFLGINSAKAIDVPMTEILAAIVHGLKFDVSIWGYLGILACAMVVVTAFYLRPRRIYNLSTTIQVIVGGIITFLLPAEAITYGAWGHHVDAASLSMLADNPGLVFASVETWFEILYFVLCGLVVIVFVGMGKKLNDRAMRMAYGAENEEERTTKGKVVTTVVALVVGGLMIIPVRGGVGIAPLNTGHAYFSQHQFANHVATNPAWNFLYSLKGLKKADKTYSFMSDEEMEARFAKLSARGHDAPKIFTKEKPNVVIILLESFSAHGISYLGGENATPNIDSLRKEGIYFTNFYASADRSGKGLLAVNCGYPSLPTINIIQHPQKTQTMPSIAQEMRKIGYESQTFMYGGDINFNNFNSLVNQCGYDRLITEDDFPKSQTGEKWGVHDEFTFRRMLEVMDEQKEPFFDFYFTLSSHEPYTVPMETVMEDEYLNSMYYTDKSLGEFMRGAREREWFKNTVFILLADHGHGGPENVGVTDRRKFNIPLLITGGAVAVKDSAVTNYGSQTDLAATLLEQLDVDCGEFLFSKNLLDSTEESFAFYDFSDGFGYVTEGNYEVYDNLMGQYIRRDDMTAEADTVSGKAYLQKIAKDFHER